MRIREAGDSALLLEVAETDAPPLLEAGGALQPAGIDADVNARAIAIARAVRQRGIAGVRDVVSTFRSVAVFFDPLATDVAAVAAALHAEADATLPEPSARIIEVPVIYGGDAGPDLTHVAAFAGCRPEAVVERHASRVYRVFMLGFLPGFAYMASVDETIAMPRHRAPRVRVPAGSVGIAGRQTGIYPRDSPGGWQIIGRTEVNLFDTSRTPPALLAPGDAVRFVPVDVNSFPVAPKPLGGNGGTPRHTQPEDAPRGGGPDAAGAAEGRSVTVIRPGFLTTVQDRGRWGYQDLGVPVSGPMDYAAHRIANAVVGNPPDAAALEATWLGPELRMEQETQLAVAGGDLRAMLDGVELPLHAAVRCRAGSFLRFGDRRTGARAYIAFDGGIVVSPVLGSRATHVLSGLGGVHGRAVRAGDRIPLGSARADLHPSVAPLHPSAVVGADLRGCEIRPAGGARLRVLPGPQAEYFAPAALEMLQRTRYTISPQSDRMGYRLSGRALAPGVIDGDMISDAAFVGAVQVPASGDPILLMVDRQTSGGYPQLAVVITADLPRAGQLGPGDWVEFDMCSRADAIAALIDLEGKLLAVR